MTVHQLPEPGVIVDLDTVERDPKDVKDPFVAKVEGRNVTFADPNEIDWRDLASVQIPQDLLRVSLSTEDLEHIQDVKMPSWKFNKLMKAYYDYYDLAEKIKQAQRQATFS